MSRRGVKLPGCIALISGPARKSPFVKAKHAR